VDFVLHQFCDPSIEDEEIQKTLDIMDQHSIESLFSSLFSRGICIRGLGAYFYSKNISVDALCIYRSHGIPTPGTLLHALSASYSLELEHIRATDNCLMSSTSGASAFDEFLLNWDHNGDDFDFFITKFLLLGHKLHISDPDIQTVTRAKRKEKTANRMTKRMLNAYGIAQMKIFVVIFSFSNSNWDEVLGGTVTSC